MARISLDPPRTLFYRIAEWFIRRRFGAPLDSFRAMGHHAQVAKAFGQWEQHSASWSRVPTKIKDLADMVTAAVRIGCPWCIDLGYWVMHGHGISREKIEAVPKWRDSNLFEPLERLAVEYAEALTATPPTVDDEIVKKLRKHLDEARLVELTMIICWENVRSRFASAMGLTPQGFRDRCQSPLLKGHASSGGRS